MEYGLIAEKLGHSYSKEIHEMLGGYPYELKEIPADGLDAFMCSRDFKGINVTIPYKEAVIPYLDEIDPAAKAIGAVNTIVNRDGRLTGYNTDYFGLNSLILRHNMDLNGTKVLILGTGGTSKTAYHVAKDLGAASIYKVSRGKEGAIGYEEAVSVHKDASFIINTTPVGMFPKCDACPIDISAFKDLSGVVDCIYNPINTDLVLSARKAGVNATGGLYMLVMQAVRACELFVGKQVSTEEAETVYRKIKLLKSNISLIGMPAVGKSTIGKLLAAETGASFIDTDEEIVRKEGREIKDIFEKEGEAYFRKLEKETILDVSGRKGMIISTGGGCIKDPDNMKALKRCGKVVFLDRPGSVLRPSASRPLSDTKEKMEALYKERLPIYKKYADVSFDLRNRPEDNIKELRRLIDED